jgi:hypothetical protein
VPNLILELEVNRVDLVDEGANSAAFIKLYKRKESTNHMELEAIIASMKPEHAEVIKAAIAKAKGEVPQETVTELTKAKADLATVSADLTVKTEELAKACNSLKETTEKAKELQAKVDGMETNKPDKMEEVMKGLDPAVQEIFKSLRSQKEAAETLVKEMNNQKITDAAIAKAKELKSLPVEETKLVEVVKSIPDEVFEILKAANAAIEAGGQFTEVGKSKGGQGSIDAWTKIEKKADEIAKEDTKLTKQQAIAKAIKDNPDLYREYLKGGAN